MTPDTLDLIFLICFILIPTSLFALGVLGLIDLYLINKYSITRIHFNDRGLFPGIRQWWKERK